MTVTKPGNWVVLRRRVSLAGRVTTDGSGPATGGMLCLTAAPAGDRRRVTSPPRQTDTGILSDGFYFFVDLPAGDYRLEGQDDRGNEIETKAVSIPAADGVEHPRVVGVDLVASAKQVPPAAGRQRGRGPGRPRADAA